MRIQIAILLSLFLTLNAASSEIHGVCDTFERSANHTQPAKHDEHPGHHWHELTDVSEVKVPLDKSENTASGDLASFNQTHSDHCHAHPTFSFLIPDFLTVPALPESKVLSTLPAAARVSAILPRLERPPRAFLA